MAGDALRGLLRRHTDRLDHLLGALEAGRISVSDLDDLLSHEEGLRLDEAIREHEARLSADEMEALEAEVEARIERGEVRL